jgi:hypothetical protein
MAHNNMAQITKRFFKIMLVQLLWPDGLSGC